MQIKVSDLKANPFRRIDKYPIDRAKVDALKISIGISDYWGTIPVRKVEDGYEIPFGHHRVAALRELGIEYIEAQVKDFTDERMLHMMAEENMHVYKSDPRIIIETVSVAKEFIDAELAKYGSWEEFRSAKNSIQISDSHAFANLKRQGSGRNIITAFLGANWKPWMVEQSLRITKDENIEIKAIEKFPTLQQARAFREEVNRHGIPKEEQEALADKIVEEEQSSIRKIPKAVQEYVREKRNEIIVSEIGKELPVDKEVSNLLTKIKTSISLTSELSYAYQSIINTMDKMNVEEPQGIEVLDLKNKIVTLKKTIERLENRLGIKTGEWEAEDE